MVRTASRSLAGLLALACLVPGGAGGGQVLEDTYDRDQLEGAAIPWRLQGTWGLREGRLVNAFKGHGEWPHERAGFYAPRAVGRGGMVRVDVVHERWIRVAGYVAIRAIDRESGAFVEWISHTNSRGLSYRTSASDPKMLSLPAACVWEAGRPATCGIRWGGVDDKTGKGRVQLLFAARGGDPPRLAVVAEVEVEGLRSLDLVELVVNAHDQSAVAPLVAFDNFYIELSDAPGIPTGLRAAAAEGHVSLSWRPLPSATAYVVQRAAAAPDAWRDVARVPAPAASHADREPRPSVLYRYRLRAENPKGRSLWTHAVKIIVPGPPLAPSKLTAHARRMGLVRVEWQNNAVNAQRFAVERRIGEAAPWTLWRAVPADTTSVVDMLTGAGQAQYRVCAVNGLGPSPWSGVAAATRPPPPPSLVSPAGRVVYSRAGDLPVTSVDLVFDQPVRTPLSPAHFTIAAASHPWHRGALPVPRVTKVGTDEQGRRARVEFAPALPDGIEYWIDLLPTVVGAAGVPAAAPTVRVGVLLGDDDGDGSVAPAPGQRAGKRLAMPPMPIGIMGEDIEWDTERDASNASEIIRLMDGYRGIDFFRINLWWRLLEPEEGRFDERYVGALRRLLAEAEKRQLAVEIGIRQEQWPLWVCKHKGFSNLLYGPDATARFARTWRRLAEICHASPVVFAYWPISEEYPSRGEAKAYLTYLHAVTAALRDAHPGCVVKARPFCEPTSGGRELTPLVSQNGPQDICMACGFYPTGAQWNIHNPNPLGHASFNNLQVVRFYSTWVQGGANGVGEIGFRAPPGADFGDAERLLAFQRTMALAWDVGLLEFVIWGEQWTFDDPTRHFPMLVAFRGELVRRPRRPSFDLRLVNDENAMFALAPYQPSKGADYSAAFRWLEERGYKYYLAAPDALPHLKGQHKASLDLSELTGKPAAEQVRRLRQALEGVEPTGIVLPWAAVPGRRQSITGLPCRIEIDFPDAAGICDAVSLGPRRLQVYAPPATLVRWRKRPGSGAWRMLTTPADARLTVLETE